MGLLDRVWRVVRANLNSFVSDAEDPEKILEQTLADMQEDLIQLRQAVAQAIATQKRTERQYVQTESTSEEWYKRAQLALQKGDDNLAREALTRRQTFVDAARALKGQLDQQGVVVTKLKENMRLLEGKIAEAKTKKDMYIARARSAEATQRINEMIGRVGTNNVFDAFDRMDEKVMQLEARSEAFSELNADGLDERFAALEGQSSVDDELAKMKSQMLSGRDLNQPNLPPAE